MAYTINDPRLGGGPRVQREIFIAKRTIPTPAPVRPPSPPPPLRPPSRASRWRMAGLTLVLLAGLTAWAVGPGGYLARRAAIDRTPVLTVISVGGQVDARLSAEASWAPLAVGDVLRAGADVRTTSAGAADLVATDGTELHVHALSRIDVPDATTARFQFGTLQIDGRRRPGDGSALEVAIALTDIRLGGPPALVTLTRLARGAQVEVRDGEILVNGRIALVSGECRVATSGVPRDLSAMPSCR